MAAVEFWQDSKPYSAQGSYWPPPGGGSAAAPRHITLQALGIAAFAWHLLMPPSVRWFSFGLDSCRKHPLQGGTSNRGEPQFPPDWSFQGGWVLGRGEIKIPPSQLAFAYFRPDESRPPEGVSPWKASCSRTNSRISWRTCPARLRCCALAKALSFSFVSPSIRTQMVWMSCCNFIFPPPFAHNIILNNSSQLYIILCEKSL